MSLPVLIALGAALSVLPFHKSQTTHHTYAEPTWRLNVAKDRFTGATQCRVYQGWATNPDVAYERQALVFRFDRRLNTLNASFRVDRGPVAAWTTVYPTLVDNGARLPAKRMDNPTSGLIILPMSVLVGGHSVTIRPTPKSRPRAYYIDGLTDTLANARLQGCDSDSVFVR